MLLLSGAAVRAWVMSFGDLACCRSASGTWEQPLFCLSSLLAFSGDTPRTKDGPRPGPSKGSPICGQHQALKSVQIEAKALLLDLVLLLFRHLK